MATVGASQILVQRIARDEIAQRVRNTQKGLVLYNPSDEWVEIKALGGTVLFPPDQNGEVIPHIRRVDRNGQPLNISANGRVEVVDRYGKKKNKRGQYQIVAMKGQSALEIVQHIVGKHPEIAYLTGDKAEDAKNIAIARQNLLKLRLQAAQRTWQGRTEFLGKWRNQNPGQDPPPPTQRQRDAKRVIDENETVQGWKQFLCRTCYQFDTDDFASFARHMRDRHNTEVPDPRAPRARVPLEIDTVGKEIDEKPEGDA